MKKRLIFGCLAALMIGFGITSCNREDVPVNPDMGGVVVNVVPAEGWAGDMENGVATYTPEQDYYPEEDYIQGTCFAFEFSESVCQNAAYNIICTDEFWAQQYQKLLNSGEWADFEDDEEYAVASRGVSDLIDLNPAQQIKRMWGTLSTRASSSLSFNVKREGKVLYVAIHNFKGVSSEDVTYAVNVWEGRIYTPDHFIFGQWNASTGVYTCNNLYSLGVNYRVEVGFDSARNVESYVTTMTFPSADWASIMYGAFREQAEELGTQFGATPKVNLTGSTVRIEAVILAEVSEEFIVQYLMFLDFANNVPMLSMLF